MPIYILDRVSLHFGGSTCLGEDLYTRGGHPKGWVVWDPAELRSSKPRFLNPVFFLLNFIHWVNVA